MKNFFIFLAITSTANAKDFVIQQYNKQFTIPLKPEFIKTTVNSRGKIKSNSKIGKYIIREIDINVGDSIIFENIDQTEHDINIRRLNTNLHQLPNQKNIVNFSVPGKYRVNCNIHPQMQLDVNVEK